MTEIESKLSHVVWCYRDSVWTTVQDGVGFIIHRRADSMWLAAYSKQKVLEKQEIHGDAAPYITILRDPRDGSMFNIPASGDFLSAVVLKYYPEILI